ncbi:hypothetical protein ACIOWI_29600 [Streptomyces sp. NPDC087659]|uniref:hypothetical protein n=1 Tax=Streptomyces sp. NPDC087659 TaxID=3365801 RepID=UPI0038247CE8
MTTPEGCTTIETELRTAAARLRDTRNCDGFNVDSDSRELLDMIRVLLRTRESLAQLLEFHAQQYADRGMYDVTVLDIARAINAAAAPGYVLGGVILDRLTGRTDTTDARQ